MAYIEGELPQQIRRVVHWGCRASTAAAISKSVREMMRVTRSDKREEVRSQLIVQGRAWTLSQHLLGSHTIIYSCRYCDNKCCIVLQNHHSFNGESTASISCASTSCNCSGSWQGVGKGSISFGQLYIYYTNFTLRSVKGLHSRREPGRKWKCFTIPFTGFGVLKIFLGMISFTVQKASGRSSVTLF